MNINRVIETGNLTRDPELRTTPNGMVIAQLGLAVNEREKDQTSGEWKDRASFFDVTVFGNQAESCGKYLSKGSPVAVDGRLRQERWKNNKGENRSRVVIIAQAVQFLGGKTDNAQSSDTPPDRTGLNGQSPEPVATTADDDIPF
jgi:single-strand DNA-binding protein